MNAPVKQAQPGQDAVALLNDKNMIVQIAKALPKHFAPDRMIRIATTELRKNPKLRECDPWSVVASVIQCAQLGLEPGSGLGHAYLVPYGKECTMIPGYKGLAELARRSGAVSSVTAVLVYEGDEFNEGIVNGEHQINWKPARSTGKREDKDIVAVIATAKFYAGGSQAVAMTREQVDAIRDGLRYKSDTWRLHYGEMAKKTAVRRLMKLMPQSPEFQRIEELDNAANEGSQFRVALQPLVEAGVVDVNYDPNPEQQQPMETPRDKEKKAATRAETVAEFDAALAGARTRGLKIGDTERLLGMESAKVRDRPIDEIENASDILNGWGK